MHGSTPVLFSPVTVKWAIQLQESSATFDKVSNLEFTFSAINVFAAVSIGYKLLKPTK